MGLAPVRPRPRLVAVSLACLVAFPSTGLALSSPTPGSIIERVSGVRFEALKVLGETRFECLGAGSRRSFGFKIYAVAFCVEQGRAKDLIGSFAQASGRAGRALADSLESDQHFFDALSDAPGEKLVVLRFLRDIPGERLGGAFLDALARVMPRDEAQKIAAVLSRGARSGDTAHLSSRGGEVVMSMGELAETVASPAGAERLWRVWLGADSATPNLKRSIAARISGLF